MTTRKPKKPSNPASSNAVLPAQSTPKPPRRLLPPLARCSRVVQLDAVAVGEIAEELAALEGVLALLPGLVAAGRIVGQQGKLNTEGTENTETRQRDGMEERVGRSLVSALSHPPCPPCPPWCNSVSPDAIAWLGRKLAGVDLDAASEDGDDQPDIRAWAADVEQATAALSAIARHRLSRVRRLLEALDSMELMEA